MAKKIKIDVEVNGKMEKATVSAKKLGGALKDTSEHAQTTDRRFKGASQQSANSTKNFSKMAQGISGGLVPAYATLAANVFALSAAYGFLKRAGDLAALRQAQQEYAYSTGTSMSLLTSRLQEATGGLLTFDEAAQAAAIGTAAGLSSDQLEGLAEIAKKASAALGRDLTDSFNRLTRGAIKAEPELLDELGIIVRLNDATETYARRLNITGRELNTFEKSQAVVNAVLEQGVKKFEDIGDAQNDIAKLGKAVDDLVKAIQTGIVPVATFIAEVFSKNVVALGAAATVMGVQFVKALAPVGPALADLDKAAGDARKRLSGAAGTSKIGKEIAGGSFEKRQLDAIEKATKSKTSKVINFSKMERNAIKKDLALIKADHARTMAANSTGFKKYTANVKAQLYAMQAEHGKVMGTMRAGVAGLASFASKAMNAIAILGVITLAISMARELINLLKSDEVRELEERVGRVSSRFQEQNEKIADLVSGLKEAETPMERLVQYTNLLSNFSFDGAVRAFEALGDVEFKTTTSTVRSTVPGMPSTTITSTAFDFSKEQRQIIANNRELAKGLPEVIKSFELKRDVLQRAGVETQGISDKITLLSTYQRALSTETITTEEQFNSYNIAVQLTEALMVSLLKDVTDVTDGIKAQGNAVKGLESAYQNFLVLKEKFTKPQSNLTQAFDIVTDLRNKLQASISSDQMQTPLGELFPEEDLKRIKAILGKDASGLTGLNLLGDGSEGTGRFGELDSVRNELREMELAQLTDRNNIEAAYQESQRSGIPFLQQEGKELKQIALINRKIKDIEDAKRVAQIMGIDMHPTVLANLEAEKKALEEQRDTIEFNTSEIGEAAQKMGASLESNMTNAFASIIDGTKSAKQAFADMAKAMLADMAQLIAKMLVQRAIMAMFGFENGGVASGGFQAFAMGGIAKGGITGYASGGIVKRPTLGLVGEGKHNEAIVPLPDGKSIPVDMKGSGQTNNVTVNVSANGSTQTTADNGQAANLGQVIAAAVQKELQNQKRAGGILNKHGAA